MKSVPGVEGKKDCDKQTELPHTHTHISSNSHRSQIVAAQSEALEQNQRHPRIVAAASKRSMRTCMQIICHHASTRAVCVVRVVPTTDSRTERLRVLLTISSNRHHLARTYLILAVVDVSRLSKEINATLE